MKNQNAGFILAASRFTRQAGALTSRRKHLDADTRQMQIENGPDGWIYLHAAGLLSPVAVANALRWFQVRMGAGYRMQMRCSRNGEGRFSLHAEACPLRSH